jgi:hypothetical protein
MDVVKTTLDLITPRRFMIALLSAVIAYGCFSAWFIWPMNRLASVCDDFRALEEERTADDKEASRLVELALRICERIPDPDAPSERSDPEP